MRAYRQATVREPSRDQLVTQHLDMARRIAKRVARRLPDWMSEDDLIAAAMVGLAEAADRYDDSRGEPFIAFAEKRVRGAVLDELRRGDILPRQVRQTARRIGQTIRHLEGLLGRPPEDTEIAHSLGVEVEHYREELSTLTHVEFVDLEPHQNIRGDESAEPAQAFERAQMLSRLRECLGRLPERDALVLSLYDLEELNYAEIGEVLGVSESRVCQLHARALVRLRAEFEAREEV